MLDENAASAACWIKETAIAKEIAQQEAEAKKESGKKNKKNREQKAVPEKLAGENLAGPKDPDRIYKKFIQRIIQELGKDRIGHSMATRALIKSALRSRLLREFQHKKWPLELHKK